MFTLKYYFSLSKMIINKLNLLAVKLRILKKLHKVQGIVVVYEQSV